MKEIVVLYHADCTDGFGAAYAAWKRFGENAEYIPVKYGQDPPIDYEKLPLRLYILDFSYPRVTLETLRDVIPHITVLDHHKTARMELEGLGMPADPIHVGYAPYRHQGLFIQFDMEESGATLAWKYFFPGEEVPVLLSYIKDRDLWRWEGHRSREMSAALRSYPQEFAVWEELVERAQDRLMVFGLIAEGVAILRTEEQAVKRICSRAWKANIGGYVVPTVNTCEHQSEVGEHLCFINPDAPFAATYMDISATERVFSLRSRGEFDVSEVAKKMGGGGHKNAAGFKVNLREDVAQEDIDDLYRKIEVDDIQKHLVAQFLAQREKDGR